MSFLLFFVLWVPALEPEEPQPFQCPILEGNYELLYCGRVWDYTFTRDGYYTGRFRGEGNQRIWVGKWKWVDGNIDMDEYLYPNNYCHCHFVMSIDRTRRNKLRDPNFMTGSLNKGESRTYLKKLSNH